jgi:hypothetical protein
MYVVFVYQLRPHVILLKCGLKVEVEVAVAVAELDRTADKADLTDGLLVLQAELITYFAHVHAIVVAPHALFVQELQDSFQEFITVKVQVELAASGVFAAAPKGIGVAIQTLRGAGTAA